MSATRSALWMSICIVPSIIELNHLIFEYYKLYGTVFVRVFESPAEVKKSCLRRVMVHQSTQCPSFFVQPLGAYVRLRTS